MTDAQATFARATLEYDEAHDGAAVILRLALHHHVNIQVVRHGVTRHNSGEAASLLRDTNHEARVRRYPGGGAIGNAGRKRVNNDDCQS